MIRQAVSLCFLPLLLGGCLGVVSDDSSTSSLEQRARTAGYQVPDVPVRGLERVEIRYRASGGSQSVLLQGGDMEGITTSGVVVLQGLIDAANAEGAGIQIWINGSRWDAAVNGSSFASEIPLNSGVNFIVVVLQDDSIDFGRSAVFEVLSQVQASPVRFELSWSDTSDIDLHIQDTAVGMHLYYGTDSVNVGGYRAALDVDNTLAYGPENIRIYTFPAGRRVHLFVNNFFHRVDRPVTATVRVYRFAERIATYTHTFPVGSDQGSGWQFDSYSWDIGQFDPQGNRIP